MPREALRPPIRTALKDVDPACTGGGRTGGGHGEVEQRVVGGRQEGEQHLGLAVRDARRQPGVELADVRLQRDCAQPAVDA